MCVCTVNPSNVPQFINFRLVYTLFPDLAKHILKNLIWYFSQFRQFQHASLCDKVGTILFLSLKIYLQEPQQNKYEQKVNKYTHLNNQTKQFKIQANMIYSYKYTKIHIVKLFLPRTSRTARFIFFGRNKECFAPLKL